EGDAVTDDVLVPCVGALAREHGPHRFVDPGGLLQRCTDDGLGHHRGTRDTDRATECIVGNVLQDSAVPVLGDVYAHRHLVPTRGVDVVHLRLEGLAQTGAVRTLAVLEDELLVQVHQPSPPVGRWSPKICGTWSSAVRSASISSVVV